ncbi:MAG: T9SS type A sorting domain-containing protein [Bacteroidales bacterium]|nr:T9SS type A sorting domain-containing protein [Bacteroidales bacterium]
MKTVLLAVFLGMFTLSLSSQNYIWTKQFKGTGQVNPWGVIQDANGNYYVYGNFNGEIKIDTVSVTAVALQDVFIAKFNGMGQLQWFKTIAGSGTESAYGIKLSRDGSFIYLTGVFNNTISLLGQNNLLNNGGNDIYLAKIDLNGNLIWAKNIAYGPTHQIGGYFDIDNNGNIIMVGQFTSSIIFYDDLFPLELTSDDPYQKQSFIAKFNADGYPQWSKMFYGTSDVNYIRNVTLIGNEYFVSGQANGNIQYDGKPIFSINSNYKNGFIMKTDANGNMQWIRKILTTNNDLYVIKHASDINGDQYITGKFAAYRIKFDSTLTDTSKNVYYNTSTNGTYDLFVAKYSRSGSLQWVKLFGSIKDENVINITHSNGQVMFTGSYGSAMNIGSFALDYKAQNEAFLAIMDLNGNILNVLNAKGKLNEIGNSAHFSNTARNYVWLGEFYSDTVSIGSNNLINDYSTKRDAFLTRYGCFDSLHFDITKVTCIGLSDGSITVTPSYGSEPYNYLWSTGATTPTVSNLAVGNYTVTVVGSNNCSMVQTVFLPQVPLLTASIINVQHNACFGGSSGSATANPINGNPPYTYKWSNGKTTQTISNLYAGTYTVTITDQCGTRATASVTITQSNKVNASVSSTPATCRGGNDGTATAIPIGGSTPYTYKWSDGQTTQTAINLLGGNIYKVTVKDGCANTVVKSITINQPAALSGTVITYASSPCVPTGSAVATGTNGTPPYTYKWNTGATTSSIYNLSANTTYTVTIKDACGAQKSISKTVGAKTITITATPTCTPTGTCQGKIVANVTGGDAPYTYKWSNGQTTQTAINLCTGYYKVTVTDVNGCTKRKTGIYVSNCAKSFTIEDDTYEDNENEEITEKIRIYPNPVSDILNIQLPLESLDEYSLIEMYDILGNLITKHQPELTLSEIKINVSHLSEGIYFIKIYQGSQIYQYKMIIRR